jgi:hypothetical protein
LSDTKQGIGVSRLLCSKDPFPQPLPQADAQGE